MHVEVVQDLISGALDFPGPTSRVNLAYTYMLACEMQHEWGQVKP